MEQQFKLDIAAQIKNMGRVNASESEIKSLWENKAFARFIQSLSLRYQEGMHELWLTRGDEIKTAELQGHLDCLVATISFVSTAMLNAKEDNTAENIQRAKNVAEKFKENKDAKR